MSEENKQIQAQSVQVLDLGATRDAMAAFERFKKDILVPDVDTWVDKNKKPHVRKPGWMKYAMAIGISTSVYDEVCMPVKFKGQEALVYNFTAKATAPNGRYAEAVGSASSDEAKPWAETLHGIRAMAQTRAVNRAISNLVGGGEVSAEELDTRSYDAQPPRRVVTPTSPPLQDRGAVIADTPNGNARDPTTLWLNILTENGVDSGTLDLIEITDLGGYRVMIKPVRFLGDVWGKLNDIIKANRGSWVKPVDDPKNGYWEVTY